MIVYAWCQSGWDTDWQHWMAMAEDGEVIASHVSSTRDWGIHDVGPTGMHRDAYIAKFGEDFEVDYRVAPAGEHGVPPEVYERNQQRRRDAEAEAEV
jgi:hypothetical protein